MVASILDAIIAQITKQLPEVAELCFISDNARNYQNDLLPFIVPMICRTYEVDLYSILHPDACCGKSCVDGHFAVSWIYVKRYIEETQIDVNTPKDLMDALIYDGGVRNTVVESIKVKHDNETVADFLTARESGLMSRLGSPTEIHYEKRQDDKLSIT